MFETQMDLKCKYNSYDEIFDLIKGNLELIKAVESGKFNIFKDKVKGAKLVPLYNF